jgi:hypothetical protein
VCGELAGPGGALAQVVRVPVGADGVAAAGPAVMLARGFCAPGPGGAKTRRTIAASQPVRVAGTRDLQWETGYGISRLTPEPDVLSMLTPSATSDLRRADSAFGVSASARGVEVAVTPGNNVNRRHCPGRASRYGRAGARRRRAPRRKTSVLPRRTCRARRDRGAVPTPLAQPLCAQGSHHTRRDSQRHDLGALQAPAALPTRPGEITTANGGQPRLTVCTGGKGHPRNPRRRGADRAAH